MGSWKKLTIGDAQNYAHKHGGKCLSDKYVNGKTKLSWSCEYGHVWLASFTNMRCNDSWCRKCVNVSRSITVESIVNIAKNNNGECIIGDEKICTRSKITWICEYGHQWISRINDVKRGSWCPKCARNEQKLSIEVAQNIAKDRCGECVSKIYHDNKSKLEWRCKNNHTWFASLSAVKRGNWCWECANHYHPNDVNKLIVDRGGTLVKIDNKNITRNSIVHYNCRNGHNCVVRLRSLVENMECKFCYYDKQRFSIKDMEKIAKLNDGFCLSEKYTNVSTKLKWACEFGHIWCARPADIQRGGWCPMCKTKNQKKLHDIMAEIYGENNVEYNYRKFDWLRNPKTNRKLEIDIFVKNIGLTVEYDGEQHYRPVRFGNISKKCAVEKFKKTKVLDKIKNRLIKKAIKDGKINNFIRFDYTERNKFSKDYVKNKLVKNNISIVV